jgi:hypothetical protein
MAVYQPTRINYVYPTLYVYLVLWSTMKYDKFACDGGMNDVDTNNRLDRYMYNSTYLTNTIACL